MSHAFGNLFKQYLSRQHQIGRHDLSQNKLAADIGVHPSVISEMVTGGRLTGPTARFRVVEIIQWFQKEGLLDKLSDANALLTAAGMSGLGDEDPVEAELIKSLKPDGAQPDGPAGPTVVTTPRLQCPPCPYPGMRPFGAKDPHFYGRSSDIQKLQKSLYENSHFLIVVGPSGSGKSSLVFAGLLPSLSQSSYWRPGFWSSVSLRPETEPFTQLAKLLGGDLADLGRAVDDTLSAAKAAESPAEAHKPERLLLVVDQFEKVFTLAKAEQDRFIAALEALRALDSCVVLLVLRADYYGDLMNSTLWPVASSERLDVGRMSRDELRQVIQKPAEDQKVKIEEALVERLLADAVDQPGSLPLLQETLVTLWGMMKAEDCTLHLSAYEQMSSGGHSGMAVAIAQHAQQALDDLPDAQKVIARRIFLRLIRFGEGGRDTARHQQVMDLQVVTDNPSLFHPTLDALASNRLLTLSGGETDSDRQVELAHEVLITGWPTLQEWLLERRNAEQTRRQLEGKVAEWVRLGRGAGGLLDEVQLLEAERWLEGPDAVGVSYSADLMELIEASRVAIEEAEQAKLDRLKAEVRAREQARRARILGGFTVALVAALIVAGALGLVAYQQSVIVRAQVLAANAVAQLDIDPERSLLLAMEAVSTKSIGQPVVPQAHEALDQALVRSRVRQAWEAHTDYVSTVAYSPDGRHLVTGGKDKKVHVWDASSGQPVTTLLGHDEEVKSVAYSRDGKLLITTSEDQTAKVWDTATWQPMTLTLEIPGRQADVLDAEFSPDGTAIVVASRDDRVRIWDTIASRWVFTFTDHTERVTSARYSPDGRYIVSTSWDNTVRVWDAVTGKTRYAPLEHEDRVTSARYSPDGLTIVSASEDGTARIWDAEKGTELRVLRGHDEWVYDARYSPDGRTIVTASGDRTSKVWNAISGEERFTLRGHTDVVSSAAYSPDGRSIVTVSLDHTLRVWDARDQLAWVLSAVYDRDGGSILSADSDKTARVWDAITEKPVITMSGHTGFLYSAIYSPDQQRVVTASADGTARVWDISVQPMGQVLTQSVISLTHGGAVTDAAYSPDGRYIVTASADHTAAVWDAVNGRSVMTLTHGHDVTSATYSPDGQRIVTTSQGNIAQFWDAPTPQFTNTLTPRPVITLTGHRDWVFDVAFSPDGTQVVTGSADRTAKIWNASNGELVRTLRGHDHVVRRVAYSSDGLFIITAGWDRTVKIWNASTGEVVLTLRGHKNRVMSATFKADGSTILTAGDDGTMYQHPVTIDALLALARSRVTRSLTEDEVATYLTAP